VHTTDKANIRAASTAVKNARVVACPANTGLELLSLVYRPALVYAAPSLSRLPSMLYKTLSASVYGIDAYLVEVEVDVGSAHMNDFNVVGLPDNAVKESRERIKSALRNCEGRI